jgi:hypothetical protein
MLDEQGDIIKPSSANRTTPHKYPINKPKSPWAKRPISKERIILEDEEMLKTNNNINYNNSDIRDRLYLKTVSLNDFHAQAYNPKGRKYGNKNEIL